MILERSEVAFFFFFKKKNKTKKNLAVMERPSWLVLPMKPYLGIFFIIHLDTYDNYFR